MRLLPLPLLAALLALAGCGDLETDYAARRGDSVNGVRVLHDELAARSDQRDSWLLSPRLDDRDLLVHIAMGGDLPDDASCGWIRNWLEEAGGPRQAVIILRDGNVAPFLCRRWSGEARAEGLDALADRLATRAEREGGDEVAASGGERRCELFATARREAAPVSRLHGLGLDRAPETLRLGAHPVVAEASAKPEKDEDDDGDGGTVLVSADGLPLIAAWPIGAYGRLVIVANATGLVDGALADPASRALTDALLRELVRFHGATKPKAAWIGSLRVREEDPQDLSLLSFLAKEPFAWPLWHLFALLAVVVLAKAAWLGRREARRDRRAARFARHVDALAEHLAAEDRRDPAVRRAVASAIALAPPTSTTSARKNP